MRSSDTSLPLILKNSNRPFQKLISLLNNRKAKMLIIVYSLVSKLCHYPKG